MRENSLLKERILEYLASKGITKYEAYANTGMSNGVLSQNNGLSEENLMRFISYYTDVNPNWLLTGEGEMLLPPAVTELKKYVKPTDDDQETGMKGLIWLVWTGFEKQSRSDFSVNSFERLADIFDLASMNVKSLQTAMETEVMTEINSSLKNGSLEFDEKEEAYMIPESMANLFSKYESVYKSLSEPAMALMKVMHSPVVQREIFEYVRNKNIE